MFKSNSKKVKSFFKKINIKNNKLKSLVMLLAMAWGFLPHQLLAKNETPMSQKLWHGMVASDVEILKKSLKIAVNCKFGHLNDPKAIARDVRQVGHRGNGDYQIQIDSDKDLEYIMSLLMQVLLK